MVTELGTCIAAIAPVTGIIIGPLTCHECQPYRWDDQGRWIVHEYADPRPPVTMLWGSHWDLFPDAIKAGDVNCRYTGMVTDETDDRCAPLMRYGAKTVEHLLMLNPSLSGDCSNIKYNTPYCVTGYLEPLRAHDGFCGPPHNNATCRGVALGQCCNSETWRCGQSDHDCARGVCYEGACFGHKHYTTDGTCGSQHADRKCAGKWGDCCGVHGLCGTGPEFCGAGKCQSGDCEGNEGETKDQDIL